MRPRSKTTKTTVLSDAVKKLREAVGVTQEDFAARLGVTITTVARWETFRSPSGIPNLLKLRDEAKKLQLFDLDDIFYSALLQESPGHRIGYITTIVAKLSDMRAGLLDIKISPKQKALKALLGGFANDLTETIRIVLMLSPTETQLPASEPGPEDWVRVMAPDLIAGQLKYYEKDSQTIAKQPKPARKKKSRESPFDPVGRKTL